MGAGAVLEPLIVVSLLFGGAWINRATNYNFSGRNVRWQNERQDPRDNEVEKSIYDVPGMKFISSKTRSLSPSLLPSQENPWRQRELRLFSYTKKVDTPNTAVFRHRFLSRVLHKFPFLVEAWYWALIYWVYQLGRAFTAVTIVEGTVHVARRHALRVIEVEKRLRIFWELPIQHFFMGHPTLMRYINWLYSFIHIPGTIAFLVWLFYYTITSNRLIQARSGEVGETLRRSTSGPWLYEARRRTMAVCNLMAFVVFTLWPCMPPRLLSDPTVTGPTGDLARSFGFVDTVHGENGAVSVWTANKFCNQWAAMPSLHFGYSLLVGVTIMTIPLSPRHRRSRSVQLPFFNQSHPSLAPQFRLPSSQRMICLTLGSFYPLSILIAIVSTANHFILDAVAGAMICVIGWKANGILLNLLPVEDYFLWCLRMHKPDMEPVESPEFDIPDYESEKVGDAVLYVR